MAQSPVVQVEPETSVATKSVGIKVLIGSLEGRVHVLQQTFQPAVAALQQFSRAAVAVLQQYLRPAVATLPALVQFVESELRATLPAALRTCPELFCRLEADFISALRSGAVHAQSVGALGVVVVAIVLSAQADKLRLADLKVAAEAPRPPRATKAALPKPSPTPSSSPRSAARPQLPTAATSPQMAGSAGESKVSEGNGSDNGIGPARRLAPHKLLAQLPIIQPTVPTPPSKAHAASRLYSATTASSRSSQYAGQSQYGLGSSTVGARGLPPSPMPSPKAFSPRGPPSPKAVSPRTAVPKAPRPKTPSTAADTTLSPRSAAAAMASSTAKAAPPQRLPKTSPKMSVAGTAAAATSRMRRSFLSG